MAPNSEGKGAPEPWVLLNQPCRGAAPCSPTFAHSHWFLVSQQDGEDSEEGKVGTPCSAPGEPPSCIEEWRWLERVRKMSLQGPGSVGREKKSALGQMCLLPRTVCLLLFLSYPKTHRVGTLGRHMCLIEILKDRRPAPVLQSFSTSDPEELHAGCFVSSQTLLGLDVRCPPQSSC